VPLSLSLSSEHSVYADLLYAQTERARGYQGRNARAILDEMDKIIADAEEAGK
jgi:DNA-damage-inducible protein J